MWRILTAHAIEGQRITVGKLGASLMPVRSARHFSVPLDLVALHCRRHQLPMLTSIVVLASNGKPSPKAFQDVDVESAQRRVFHYPWQIAPAISERGMIGFEWSGTRASWVDE